jgi:hypothetical protein
MIGFAGPPDDCGADGEFVLDKVHEHPRLTFSALAKLMAPHTSEGIRSIVRASKYPKRGPMLSYANATKHMVGILVDGEAADVELREYEQEVVDAFDPAGLKLPRGFEIKRSSTRDLPWLYHGVKVSMYSEARLRGSKGNGCLKLLCTQDPLAKGVGKAMANLMAYHRRSVLGDQETNPGYCIVYEVRSSKVHKATSGPVSDAFLAKAEAACDIAAALWPRL